MTPSPACPAAAATTPRLRPTSSASSGRELALGPELQAAEAERLRKLLDRDGTRDELNAQLCAAIANASLTPDANPALIEHFWATTAGNLAIDQPEYATYRRLLPNK